MPEAENPTANVRQAVPFFHVTSMDASLRFYRDALGFRMTRWWIPDVGERHYPADGSIRWCLLEIGDAALMLQEFQAGRKPAGALGAGVNICFQCVDALALYREFRSSGVQTSGRPFVGNGMWVVTVVDPDGYRMEFSSPTEAPEESELEE